MGGGGIPYPCRRREQFENYTGARKRVARHPAMTHCHAIRSGSGRWKFTRRWWKWASLGPHDDLNETGAINVKCRGFVFSRQEKCSSSFIGFNRNFPFEKKFFFPKFSKHRSIEFLFPFIYRRRSFEIIAESALFFFSLPGRSVKMAARFFSFFLSFFFSLAAQWRW